MTRLRRPKKLRLIVFCGFVATLLLTVGAWIAREEYHLRSGREIVLQSVPVDPVDLLRGQYLTLGYVAQDVYSVAGDCYDKNNDGWLYVTLDRKDRYWLPVDCKDTLESRSSLGGDAVILKAQVSNRRRATYPNTDRYYVPDGTPAPPKPPDVVLSVTGDGNARIRRIEIDGKAWP